MEPTYNVQIPLTFPHIRNIHVSFDVRHKLCNDQSRKPKMADYQQETKFPPGWDCKYDTNTGKW